MRTNRFDTVRSNYSPMDPRDLCPDDLTDIERSVVAAMRREARARENRAAEREQTAWQLIEAMTSGILAGEPESDLRQQCDPEQFLSIWAAASANASAIRTLTAMDERLDREIARQNGPGGNRGRSRRRGQ